MKAAKLTLPEIILIGGTRVAMGAGLGFLLANKVAKGARKYAGWTLFGIGALSTIPLAINVIKKRK
jgi:hypothetical protein